MVPGSDGSGPEPGSPDAMTVDASGDRAAIPCEARCPACGARHLVRFWVPDAGTEGPWTEALEEAVDERAFVPCEAAGCEALVDLAEPGVWSPIEPVPGQGVPR